jgi:signal transduction histidine kinase
MNLFQKGLLAFAVVILIAVATVAILAGYRTETAFRRYAMLYSGRTQMLVELLESYYAQTGSWEGVQGELPMMPMGGRGRGRGGPAGQAGMEEEYTVLNARREIVAGTAPVSRERISDEELALALPLVNAEETVGYLFVDSPVAERTALDAPAEIFLSRLRRALIFGGGIAFLAALLMAGLLTRGIVSPVRTLTEKAEHIATGNFDVRADVRGGDEISRLAATFNEMVASLQRTENARQAQMADIAHELRNPLAILQSSLEALADGIYDATPDNIEPALDQVQTLNRLVDDLRTLALADAGQLHLDLQPLDLGSLTKRVAEGHRETLEERGVSLEVAISSSLPMVRADYARITQVLNNILSNAARYVPSGSAVRVTVDAESAGAVARVVDNGPGVPDDLLPRLFDRFWRRESLSSDAAGGSGLGLAIAQQIIAAHDGRIWVEATPGGGLTVGFWLEAP